ncbi:MAG: hypothetical protein AAGJ70_06460 [Pseudomonadota bacterium]
MKALSAPRDRKPDWSRRTTEREVRAWGVVVPTLTIAALTLVITLPWGFDPLLVNVPPLLILMLIFCWTVRCPQLVPAVLVFAVGIAVDVVTASPVGFWAFLFLVGYALAAQIARFAGAWPLAAALLGFPPISVLVAGLSYAIQSGYFARVAPLEPVMASLKIAWFALPAIVIVVAIIDRRMTHSATQAIAEVA